MSAIGRMEGGTHYLQFAIQPVEFAMANRWDFCASNALKYLSRFRYKDGLKDLKKGKHFVELRWDFEVLLTDYTFLQEIHMGRYIVENGIDPADGVALMALDSLVNNHGASHKVVIACIDEMIRQYEGAQSSLKLEN